MIQVAPQMRILVAIEAVDLRKGIDGLAQLCREKLGADPFSGCLFIFRSRRATAIKVLAFDGQGFWSAKTIIEGAIRLVANRQGSDTSAPGWRKGQIRLRFRPGTQTGESVSCGGPYARVSTNDQQTPTMQNRAMREYVGRRGWIIAMQVREVGSERRSGKHERDCWKRHGEPSSWAV